MRKSGLVRALEKKEAERAVLCQAGKTHEKRNVALLRFAFATGLRATEIQRLLIENVFDSNWKIKSKFLLEDWQTKCKEERFVYFGSPKAHAALKEYVEERRAAAKKTGNDVGFCEPLFKSQKGGAFKHNQIVQLLKKILVHDAGLQGLVASHTCRVTGATLIAERTGGNLKIVQKFLGHSEKSVKCTMRYIRPSDETVSALTKLSILD